MTLPRRRPRIRRPALVISTIEGSRSVTLNGQTLAEHGAGRKALMSPPTRIGTSRFR
jgi:hypothetical protein